MVNIRNPEKIVLAILKVIITNWYYFRNNPAHLAWAMMHYELAHRAGCHLANLFDSKYPIVEICNKMSKEDANLFYDAWAITFSNSCRFHDVNEKIPLQSKKNKTLQDWIEIFTNPEYEYSKLFISNSDDRVKDYLLCTVDNGYSWNQDGFLCNIGLSGIDQNIFAGYTKVEKKVNEKIRKKIKELSHLPAILKYVKNIEKIVQINTSNNSAKKNYYNNLWKIEESPVKDKKSLKKAFEFVCYLECLIDSALKWSVDQWDNNCKNSNIVVFDGLIDVSQIKSTFYTSHSQMCDMSRIYLCEIKEMESMKIPIDYRESLPFEDEEVLIGWDAIRKFVDDKKKFLNGKKTNSSKIDKPKHYPISSYSLMITMPLNVHASYLEAAREIAQEIVNDPHDRISSYELAKSFLEKWKL